MSEIALAFADHDHGKCRAAVKEALTQAAQSRGLRLTPARVRVLELLAQEHRAMGAYELLDQLREEGLGSQPPVIYRALDFLVQAGFVHKIERLNAYVACSHPDDHGETPRDIPRGAPGDDNSVGAIDSAGHGVCFLICGVCRNVAEVEDGALEIALAQTAAGRGFAVRRTVLEIEGICPACRSDR